MADTKLTDLTALTTPASTDKAYIVDVSDTTDGAAGTSKVATISNMSKGIVATNLDVTGLTSSELLQVNSGGTAIESGGVQLDTSFTASEVLRVDSGGTTIESSGLTLDGWIDADESWSYSAWDDTNGVSTATITVPSDATTKYQAGMRVKCDQTTDGTKYGIITKVASTTLTVFMNTDYDFDNETITNPYYSPMDTPFGFDRDPDKWTVETTDATSTSITDDGTWNNSGISIDVPIGSWDVYMQAALDYDHNSSEQVSADLALSTSTSSVSNDELVIKMFGDGDGLTGNRLLLNRLLNTRLSLTAKDTYYILGNGASGASAFNIRGDLSTTIIRAKLSYV